MADEEAADKLSPDEKDILQVLKARAAYEVPDEIRLEHPVIADSGTVLVEVLKVKPLELRHLDGIPWGGDLQFDHLKLIASRMFGESPAHIGRLRGKDAAAVSRLVLHFLADYL